MSRKRILVVFLMAAVLAAAVFFLLRSPSGRPKSAGEDRTRVIRVVLWDYGVVDYDEKLVAAFEEAHPDIQVDVISYSPYYYNTSLEALLDSGETVDVIYVNQLTQLYQLTERHLACPLDDWLMRDGLDPDRYPDLDILRSENGELLGLPYRKDKFLLYYNQALFDRTGTPRPTALTWDGFRETAKTLKRRMTSGEYPAYIQIGGSHLRHILGSEAADEKTRSLSGMDAQLKYLLALEADGLVLPYGMCENLQASQHMFETGNYGMFVHGTWYLNILKADSEAGRIDFPWGVAAKPVWYTGAKEQNALWMTPLCISARSEEKEASWEFLKFVCGLEGAAIMADQLMIPAYEDTEIRSRLEAQLASCGVDPDLVLEDYGEPLPILNARERAQRSFETRCFMEGLLGLDTPEEARKKAASFLS